MKVIAPFKLYRIIDIKWIECWCHTESKSLHCWQLLVTFLCVSWVSCQNLQPKYQLICWIVHLTPCWLRRNRSLSTVYLCLMSMTLIVWVSMASTLKLPFCHRYIYNRMLMLHWTQKCWSFRVPHCWQLLLTFLCVSWGSCQNL